MAANKIVPEWADIGLNSDFASEAERELATAALKYLADEARLENDRSIETPHGTVWLGLVITLGSSRFCVEIPGQHRHSGADSVFRHVAILTYSNVKATFRLSRETAVNYTNEALYLLATAAPELFSRRGRSVLATASRMAKAGSEIGISDLHVDGALPLDEYDPADMSPTILLSRFTKSDALWPHTRSS